MLRNCIRPLLGIEGLGVTLALNTGCYATGTRNDVNKWGRIHFSSAKVITMAK